jgi:glutamyl-tRNA synthetase
LVAWWQARSAGGQVRLRMDDLDVPRAAPEFDALAQRDLEWLGLDWDGEILRQSEHVERLRAAAMELQQRGLAYPCVCTRGDIRLAVSAPHGPDGISPYPGTCAGRFDSIEQAEALTGKLAGLRFSVPVAKIQLQDQLSGTHEFDLRSDPGDFLILRRDKVVAYQLSVVVDDAFQGVTEVVRGDDLLASTPRQIAVARALGLARPNYCHLPLVADASGTRLAKRSRSLSLKQLREQGVDPRNIVSWAATTCGLRIPTRVTAADVTSHFDVTRIPTSRVRIDTTTIEKWIATG